MDTIKAPQAEAAEAKALDAEVKQIRTLNNGERENTLNELREAGVVSPNDRRIALAAKGGPEQADVQAPAIPVPKDVDKEKLAVAAVKEADKVAGDVVDTDTPKQKVAKAKLHSK